MNRVARRLPINGRGGTHVLCATKQLTMYIESELSVSTTEYGAYKKTTSAGEYEYVECSRCNEILYENTAGSQHL